MQIAGWLERDYPLTASTFRARCIGVWPPATSWTILIPGLATARGEFAVGVPARWSAAASWEIE